MVRRHRIDDGIRVINNRLFFCGSLFLCGHSFSLLSHCLLVSRYNRH